MGNKHTTEQTPPPGSEPAILHIYTSSRSGGWGTYHTGLEIYGTEYVFAGGATTSTGIQGQKPKWLPKDSEWVFKESVVIDYINKSKSDVQRIIAEMKPNWPENSYHITSRNCNHFTDALCKELTGKGIPSYLNRLAKVGNIFKGLIDDMNKQQDSTEATTTSYADSPVEKIEYNDLLPYIHTQGVACLNQDSQHPVSTLFQKQKESLFKKKQDAHLQSDADEQLLIYIPFTQNIKLFSIIIAGPEQNGPKTVKLYANKSNMDFTSVESNSVTPTQVIQFSPEMVKEATPFNLRFVNFQNVNNLTIFIESNQGSVDNTIISRLTLIGAPSANTNIKNLTSQ